MNKIKSIEGIRTIGWFGVYLCHFLGAFYPNRDWFIDKTPLKFIYSGNAYVRLLFAISGFVLSYKYFVGERYERVWGDIVKRYFRLMPPVLFCEVMVFAMMKLGWFKNVEAAELVGSVDFLGMFNRFEPTVYLLLKEALIGAYVRGTNRFIGPLWTMEYEYLGAILVLAALYVLRKRPWRWLFYAAFLFFFNGYYNYLVMGMLVCDLFVNTGVSRLLSEKGFVRIGAIVIGYLMLSMAAPDDSNKVSRVIFGAGIIIFLLGILCSKRMEKFLGNRVMVESGKMAYSAYIVHWPIVETFSCALVLLLYGKGIHYNVMIWMIFFLTLAVIVVVSRLISKYIEPVGARITGMVLEWRPKNEE